MLTCQTCFVILKGQPRCNMHARRRRNESVRLQVTGDPSSGRWAAGDPDYHPNAASVNAHSGTPKV